jgi:hypothetical protein
MHADIDFDDSLVRTQAYFREKIELFTIHPLVHAALAFASGCKAPAV